MPIQQMLNCWSPVMSNLTSTFSSCIVPTLQPIRYNSTLQVAGLFGEGGTKNTYY